MEKKFHLNYCVHSISVPKQENEAELLKRFDDASGSRVTYASRISDTPATGNNENVRALGTEGKKISLLIPEGSPLYFP